MEEWKALGIAEPKGNACYALQSQKMWLVFFSDRSKILKSFALFLLVFFLWFFFFNLQTMLLTPFMLTCVLNAFRK